MRGRSLVTQIENWGTFVLFVLDCIVLCCVALYRAVLSIGINCVGLCWIVLYCAVLSIGINQKVHRWESCISFSSIIQRNISLFHIHLYLHLHLPLYLYLHFHFHLYLHLILLNHKEQRFSFSIWFNCSTPVDPLLIWIQFFCFDGSISHLDSCLSVINPSLNLPKLGQRIFGKKKHKIISLGALMWV